MKNIKFTHVLLLVISMGMTSVSLAQYRSNSSVSQGPVTPVKLGSVILNLGVGVGSEYKDDNNSPFGTKLAVEVGLWQAGPGVITLGGELGGSFTRGGYYSNYKAQTFVVGTRAAWHYGWNVRGLDTYGGVSFGAGFHHYEYDNVNNNGLNYSGNDAFPVVGGFVGASYFISPGFGFNAEAGHDITDFQVGIIFKIR